MAEPCRKCSNLQTFFDTAFTSDRFKAVDSSAAKQLFADSFSPTGSVFQSIYLHADLSSDDTCSDVSTVVGYMVNECFIGMGYSYKFQLTSGWYNDVVLFSPKWFTRLFWAHSDSCEGAITQYFEDDECSSYLGFSSFNVASLACAPMQDITPTQYEQIQCTTREAPAFPDTSNMIGST